MSLSLSDIKDAQERIAPEAVRTPLHKSRHLDEVVGASVFLKCENLQRTGSFKFRGAYNAIAKMSDDDRARGILAVSSGNHAQGVAEAARLFGAKATIVMPEDAPTIKVDRVKRAGAEVVPYHRTREDRDEIAHAIAARTGAVFVHPYENPDVMAGQGTAGLETIHQLEEAGARPELGLICCGGGGLTAGVSTAWRHAFPDIEISAVEPELFDDTTRSLQAGERLAIEAGYTSICDAILTPMPGSATFPILQSNSVGGFTVSDQEVLRAMAFAFREMKMVVEPGGAVCLAAILSGRLNINGRTVVAVLSGGNTDPELVAQALAQT
ncbi:MAG: threonine/serine dehydratase [Pseudomonadota bacterium]